jgi:hypothetical protein
MTECLPGNKTNAFPTHTIIAQCSPLSPIYFLFYSTDLVGACNIPTAPASGIGFVDEVNALAFSQSTGDCCRTLQSLHEHFLEWARKHGAFFAPKLCILVHFTKARRKHNTTCHLTMPSTNIFPISFACVLGIILDKKISWQPHIKPIKSKLATQTNLFTRLMAYI